MDRDQARKLIARVFDRAADDVGTERLISMRNEVEARMKAARMKGLYSKVAEALDTEIEARRAEEKQRAAALEHG
ncbi:MAG TPA: hypothetical protein VMX94_11595 [Armatimonadota bacterium]|nr:hypothetical protein [Armatimonadota bacterium]